MRADVRGLGTHDPVADHLLEEVARPATDAAHREHRREEIARMLSGAEITDEARAAALQLLGQGATLQTAGGAA